MFFNKVKYDIKSDLSRYYTQYPGLKKIIFLFLIDPCFRYMVLYRVCSSYSRKNVLGFISRIWYNNLKSKFALQIYLKVRIGRGFKINHYGNIIINQGVLLGENCNISQGVTIGSVSRGKLKGCPTIGDRVWIGANAMVVGKISIGNDVLIAPLSYVNCDIPDGAVVSGNPCKINNYNGSGIYVKNLYESGNEEVQL